jgi:hypothetical protein
LIKKIKKYEREFNKKLKLKDLNINVTLKEVDFDHLREG